MVSEVNNKPAGYGQINRVGTDQNGRVIYQMADNMGNTVGKLSVAQKDADTFERCKNTILQNAPKIEQYQQSMTPEKAEKLKKKTKWIIGGGAFLGSAIPLFGCRSMKTWQQIILAIAGTVVGTVAGVKIATKAAIPPGMAEFQNATAQMNKLDIQKV